MDTPGVARAREIITRTSATKLAEVTPGTLNRTSSAVGKPHLNIKGSTVPGKLAAGGGVKFPKLGRKFVF